MAAQLDTVNSNIHSNIKEEFILIVKNKIAN